MKNLLKNKVVLGFGILLVIIAVLAVTGALKMNVDISRTDTGQEQVTKQEVSAPTKNEVVQMPQLMTKETTFEAASGMLKMAIKLPVGWALGSHQQLDFVAGSQIAEKLPGGLDFTVNLNVSAAPHPSGVSSFADYESQWKAATLNNNPSMEEVASYSKKVNGLDVYVLEMLNTRPDGISIHQIQYVFYLNDNYYAVATASAPDTSWDKYSRVLIDSVESLRMVM